MSYGALIEFIQVRYPSKWHGPVEDKRFADNMVTGKVTCHIKPNKSRFLKMLFWGQHLNEEKVY